MNFIGRKKELQKLNTIFKENGSKIFAILGKRGIGKTELINEFKRKYVMDNNHSIYFEMFGQKGISAKTQIKTFIKKLLPHIDLTKCFIEDWNDLFFYLSKELIPLNKDKKIIFFIDEFPWLHTKKSGFIQAFSTFWNNIQHTDHIYFILTGSAVAWMNKNIINTSGGLYGRISDIIHLQSFSFLETVDFLKNINPNYSLNEFLNIYFMTGGTARYLKRIRYEYNLEECRKEIFQNEKEFDLLFDSSFESYLSIHRKIVELFEKHDKLKIKDIVKKLNCNLNVIYPAIEDLVNSDILYKTPLLTKNGNSLRDNEYSLKDLFCYSFLKLKDNFSKHREDVINGYAFEIFARLNINLIREALGRSSLNFKAYTWNNEHAQIDLVLEDEDNSYYIIECKNYNTEFEISKHYLENLNNKLKEFNNFLFFKKRRKQLKLVLFSTFGTKSNPLIPFIDIKLEDFCKK